jgi:hypothetical protein
VQSHCVLRHQRESAVFQNANCSAQLNNLNQAGDNTLDPYPQ